MITETQDRGHFIGGSECQMIYANYNTATFKSWWEMKLRREAEPSFSNPAMAVGTILEDDVITLYEHIHGNTGERGACKVKGIARANTDYIQGDKVSDVKVSKKAFEWFLAEKVPIHYRRQLIHYCYVFDLRKASIIAYLNNGINPFEPLDERKLYEIEVAIKESDIEKHKQKLEYLEFCRDCGIYPAQ